MACLKSDSLKELGVALTKAQSEMLPAGVNSDNPFHKSKYANFTAIVKSSRPALTRHGLSVIQRIIPHDDGFPYLCTMLLHTSGEYLESMVKIAPAKQDPQSFGSCLSYLKRYSYASIVGVICDDEDDDGEVAMKSFRDEREKSRQQVQTEVDYISVDQYNELAYELNGHPDIVQQVLDGLKINTLREMPRNRYRQSLDRVREIKANKSDK